MLNLSDLATVVVAVNSGPHKLTDKGRGVLLSAVEELSLWRSIHDVGCYVQQNAVGTPDQRWAVLDVDGDAIEYGPDPVEAMRAAIKLFSPEGEDASG